MVNLEQYYEQYEGLKQALADLVESINKSNDEQIDDSWPGKDILSLLKRMNEWTQGQFLFFYHGFSEQRPAGFPKLNWHSSPTNSQVQYPPEHVLATILDQISGDLATIKFCSEQRFLHYKDWKKKQEPGMDHSVGESGHQTIASVSPEKEDAFAELDGFAKGSIWPEPSLGNELFAGKKVLTYFTDSVKVRVMPYAHVALVGFPPSVLQHSRGLYTAAHEIGHFLFWYPFKHSQGKRVSGAEAALIKSTRNVRELFFPFRFDLPTDSVALSKQPPPPPWGEEIFADAYGALIGGPLYVNKAMDLALGYSTKLFSDPSLSDSHPMPLIRPLLILKALVALDKRMFSNIPKHVDVKATAAKLLGEWEQKLKEREVFDYRERSKNLVVWDLNTLDTNLLVEDLVDRAVRALHYVLPDAPAKEMLWGWAENPKDAIKKTTAYLDQVAQLFKQAELLMSIVVPPLDEPPAPLQPVLPPSWLEWVVNEKDYYKWEKDSDENFVIPEGEIWAGDFDTVMDPSTRSTNTWLPVFGAGGWTTGGPCDGPGRP